MRWNGLLEVVGVIVFSEDFVVPIPSCLKKFI